LREMQLDQRWWKLSAVTLLLLAAFLVPRRAEAIIYCSLDTMTTPTIMKKGTTCAAAKQKIIDNTLATAQQTCIDSGYDLMCGTSTVTYTTMGCTYDPIEERYYISGYRTFRCGINEPCPTCLSSN
jgi:hypothetical protein